MIHIDKCLICNGNDFKLVTDRGHFFSGEKALFCTACGFVFLSPRMTPDELRVFYSSNRFSKEFRGSESPSQEMIAYRNKRAERRFRLLSNHLNNLTKGSVLEIGCSSGNFLNMLNSERYTVYGIDPSKGFAEYAKKEYGLNVVAGMYPDDMPENISMPFAAVFAFQVLEHTTNPGHILKTIFQQLDEDGFLFLEIPDLERATKVRKYLYPGYFQKSHLWDFGRSTATMLLKTCGFSVCDYFYDNESPYDKNTLIVARKQVERLADDSAQSLGSVAALNFYRLLKFKLFLGKMLRPFMVRLRNKEE
ncbi:MAG: methyltransferase domain-containing protein [Nitrospiraceae bacterium]|nr:MAG: methyltransferase domain-containing protein [Nitrospiraceae bacterium]